MSEAYMTGRCIRDTADMIVSSQVGLDWNDGFKIGLRDAFLGLSNMAHKWQPLYEVGFHQDYNNGYKYGKYLRNKISKINWFLIRDLNNYVYRLSREDETGSPIVDLLVASCVSMRDRDPDILNPDFVLNWREEMDDLIGDFEVIQWEDIYLGRPV